MIEQAMRKIISSSKYTQTDLANQFGISQPRFNQYLTGKREPDLAFIVKFCDFFNITPDVLLGYKNTPNTPDDISLSENKFIEIISTAFNVFYECMSKNPREIKNIGQKMAEICLSATKVDTTEPMKRENRLSV